MLILLLHLQALTLLLAGDQPVALVERDPSEVWPVWVQQACGLRRVEVPPVPSDGQPIYARLVQLDVGNRAWLDAGQTEQVQPGSVWWLRAEGQPLARFEVLHVEPDRAYGVLTTLARGVRPAVGMQFQRWYLSGQKDLTAAVSFVDEREPLVYVALPPSFPAVGQRVTLPGGAARGILEQRDARFGQIRLSPASQTTETPPGCLLRIAPAPLQGRLFDPSDTRGYIDLGRVDELAVGRGGWAEVDGKRVEIEVTQVRDSYARVTTGEPLPAGTRVYFGANAASLVPPRVLEVPLSHVFVCSHAPGLTAGQVVHLGDGRQVFAFGRIVARLADGRLVGVVSHARSLRDAVPGDRVSAGLAE